MAVDVARGQVFPGPPHLSGTAPNSTARVSAEAVTANRLGFMDAPTVLTGYVLLLMLVPSPLVLPSLGAIGTPANIYAILALLWYTAAWVRGRLRPAPGTRTPRVAIGVFGTAILLSYVAHGLRAPSTLETQAADRSLIQLTAWIGLVLLSSAGIHEYSRLDQLLRRLVVCAGIVAAVGILEFFTDSHLAGLIHIPGLQANGGPAALMTRGDFTRPISTTTQPLEFGATMALVLPFAIHQAFDLARGGAVRRWLPVLLISAALPMTVSRTSVIGAGVVLLVLLPTWQARRRWPALCIIVVGAAGLRLVAPGLIGTLVNLFSAWFNGGDSSTQARTKDYGDIIGYFAQRPLFGRGFQTFLPQLYRYTDNMYLLALVEMGIVGVVGVFTLYVACLHCGRAGRRGFTDPTRRELGQSFVAAAAAALCASATFDTLSFPMFSGVFFLLLGCSGAYLGLAKQSAGRPVAGASPDPAAQ